MKKIFITGACGFVGSHLAEMFVSLGYNVVAFDRYNNENNFGHLENSKYKNEMKIILGDIRDYDSVFNAMKGSECVIHLAALIGIPYSYISPLAYIKTNIEGTYNILETAKNLSFKQVIITSTSETYGTAQYTPIDEKHPMVAQSPYAASKISADQLSLSYFRAYNVPVKIIRPFNIFGPRQSLRAIIPTIITQILGKKDYITLGSLEVKRDFTYVSDACNAYLSLLNSPKFFGEVVNVGMNKNISINDLVNLISSKLKYKPPIKIDNKRVRPINSEVTNLICDNEKIISLQTWKPQFNISTGLDITIEWLKKNKDNYNIEHYYV